MEEYRTQRIRYVEVAKDIYAAITPAQGLDITDAGMMDNFSNSAYINRGKGLVCDTFFDLPHALDLREFCVKKSGHAPGIVINTHGHWDHFWGNQVFAEATIMGHKDMVKDCRGDKHKVPVFKLLHGSRGIQNLMGGVMTAMFKKNLPEGKKAKFVVSAGQKDFNLTGVEPKQPDTLLEGNTVLDLDGLEVQLLHLGGIHSSSDTVVWIPSEKVLFAGDIFADCSLPMSLEGGKRWIEVMDHLLDELEPEIIVPGHGEVYDRERAESQRAYFRSLLEQFEENYRPGIKADELIAKIDVSEFIDHRPRLGWIMAVNSMLGQARKTSKAEDSFATNTFYCQRGSLTIRGTEYRPEGENLPVAIVSHGFMATQDSVRTYAKELARMGYATFCYDFCGGCAGGKGKSDGETTDMSVLTEVQDLEAVIAYVQALPYTGKELLLAGCSQGGFVSALTAAKHPEMVGKLVLFYPALCIPDDARAGRMMFAKFDPQNIPERINCGPMMLGRCYVADVIDMDPFAAISPYTGPVLILHGTKDKIVHVDYSHKAHAAYANSQLCIIEGGAHGFNTKHDAIAIDAMKKFAAL